MSVKLPAKLKRARRGPTCDDARLCVLTTTITISQPARINLIKCKTFSQHFQGGGLGVRQHGMQAPHVIAVFEVARTLHRCQDLCHTMVYNNVEAFISGFPVQTGTRLENGAMLTLVATESQAEVVRDRVAYRLYDSDHGIAVKYECLLSILDVSIWTGPPYA